MSISRTILIKLLFIFLLGLSSLASARELEGVKIDDVMQVGNTTLQLNGAGLRKKLIFKVYVGALYLVEQKHTAAAILADAGQKRLTIHLLRDLSSEQLQEAFNKGLSANNTPDELVALEGKIKEFLSIFRSSGEIAKGGLITLDFIPGEGTRISINGAEKAHIAGAEFSRALLKIWLGEDPADESLKKGLTGN
jgi:long-chain acyl-CoA synthetase